MDAYIWAAVGLGLLLSQPMLAPGLPQAPDALLHFYRSVIWRSAWDAGVLWPRWDTIFYQGYGCPLFNFYGPLLCAGSAVLSYVTGSIGAGFKGMLLLACLAYPLGMYLWARDIVGRRGAIVAAAAYAFATFRFRELYFLGGYAQFLAWGLYPWILFFFYRLAKTRTAGYFLGATAGLAALALAHNISAMVFLPVLLVYAAGLGVAFRRPAAWPVLAAAGVCGIGIASIFWLPALGESGLTRVRALTQGVWDVKANFLRLADLAAPILTLDDRAARPVLPFTFGRLHLALAATGVAGFCWAWRRLNHSQRWHAGLAIAGLLAATVMMLPGSLPIWRTVPFIAFTEYPWRLFGIAFLFSSLLAGYALTWLDGHPRPQCLAAAAATVALVVVVGVYQFPRQFLDVPATLGSYVTFETSFRSLGTTAGGEYLSRWTASVPKQPAVNTALERTALLQPAPGQNGAVTKVGPESLLLHVSLAAAGDITVAQFYFPGWRATVDGVPAQIRPAEPSGCIQLFVPAGEHEIRLEFRDTAIRRVGLALSAIALLACGLVAWRMRKVAYRGRSASMQQRWHEGGILAAVVLALLAAKAVWIGPDTAFFRYSSPANAAAPAQHQTSTTIGGLVTLLGYDLDAGTVAQGSDLHVRLYWQALHPLDRDYSSFVQLTAGPKKHAFAGTNHQHPCDLPTHSWSTSQYIVDDFYVQIPPDMPAISFDLQVGWFDKSTGERSASMALADRVLVTPERRLGAGDVPHKLPTRLGNAIQFLGYDVKESNGGLTVTLYWQASAPPTQDSQVFVQVFDGEQRLLGQADSAPVNDLYPTSLWQPGQIIADPHQVPIPAGSRPQEARVGLYDLKTMQRMPAQHSNGSRWQDDAIVIPVAPGG